MVRKTAWIKASHLLGPGSRASLHCLAPAVCSWSCLGWSLLQSWSCSSARLTSCPQLQKPLLSLLLRQCWCLTLEWEPGKRCLWQQSWLKTNNWGGPLKGVPASFLGQEMILGIPSSQHLVSLNSGIYGFLEKTWEQLVGSLSHYVSPPNSEHCILIPQLALNGK